MEWWEEGMYVSLQLLRITMIDWISRTSSPAPLNCWEIRPGIQPWHFQLVLPVAWQLNCCSMVIQHWTSQVFLHPTRRKCVILSENFSHMRELSLWKKLYEILLASKYAMPLSFSTLCLPAHFWLMRIACSDSFNAALDKTTPTQNKATYEQWRQTEQSHRCLNPFIVLINFLFSSPRFNFLVDSY